MEDTLIKNRYVMSEVTDCAFRAYVHSVLTLHIGSATVVTRRALAKIAVDNVLSILAGEKPLNPVT